MFFANYVLSKKGALARIWLAAHWEKKLTKAQVNETNIERSVEAIMQPQIQLALRTSGHLLVGVVRIYSRKTNYLLTDCNDAIVRMKFVFRPGAVDLPEERQEADLSAINLRETFNEFEAFLPPVPPDFDASTRYAVYQRKPEEITLREDENTAAGHLLSASLGTDHSSASPTQLKCEATDGVPTFDFEEMEPTTSDVSVTPVPEADMEAVHTDALVPSSVDAVAVEQHPVRPVDEPAAVPDETTLIGDSPEAFVLAPIDTSALGTARRSKVKRKLVIDELKLIPSNVIRAHQRQTSTIVVPLDLAPPTKKLMLAKKFGSADKLLTMPGKRLINHSIRKLFSRNLVTSRRSEEELESVAADDDEVEVDRGTRHDMRDVSVVLDRVPEIAELSATSIEQPRRWSTADNRSIRLSADDVGILSPRQSPVSSPRSSRLEDEESTADNMEIPDLGELPQVPSSLGFHPPTSDEMMATPIADKDSVFNQTLQSTAMDTTLLADYEVMQEDSDLLNQRATKLIRSIRDALGEKRAIFFSELVANNSRKQVTSKFYVLLSLQNRRTVQVEQRKPYADIRISPGPEFNAEPTIV